MADLIITDEERALLRFPGSVPGVLRRGSPVTLGSDRGDIPRHLWGRRGTVHRIAQSDLGVPLAAVAVDGCESVVLCGLDVLSLDLTDATGRAHLAWWWFVNAPRASFQGRVSDATRNAPERVSAPCVDNLMSSADLRVLLSGIDPNDPRPLPDGSRLVDALALSIVARHVAGLDR